MHVDLYATHDCPHCQRLAHLLQHTLEERPEVECRCVDVEKGGPELEAYGYRTSPLVVVDGRVICAGHEAVHDLLAAGARFA